MTKSSSHTAGDTMLIAKTLLLIAPNADFAAGVVALAHALNATDWNMNEIIARRWQYWSEKEPPCVNLSSSSS